MQTATVPWIVATMIHDSWINEVQMHNHLCGNDVEGIRQLRDGNEGHWPMVDLWARIPVEFAEYGMTACNMAKELRGESDRAYNAVGW